MKKAQANKLSLQTVQNEKELKKPIDGNNQVKSDKKKHIEQKKTSELKNKVNTPYKEKKNFESHTKTKSNLLTKNTELFSKKRQMEEFSKTIRQKQNNFPNKKTTKNQSPKKTINNSILSNNIESSQLTRSVQGKPRFSLIKTTGTKQENNRQKKIRNSQINIS